MRLERRAFLALPVVLALPALTRVARAEGDLVRSIAKAQARVKTIVGPFTQERTIGLLKSVVRSRGTLTMVRPDRLRWELAPPDDVVYWVTPEGFAYRSAQGAGRIAATSARLAESLDDVRSLLGDVSRLATRYELSERAREDGGVVLEASPKEGVKGAFRKISLELGSDRVRPLRATLVESAKDKTEIVFGELIVDGPVDPKLLVPKT